MTRILPVLQPLFMLTAMSYTGFTSPIRYTINGFVRDEAGVPVADADVLIMSATELKRTISSDDGSFTAHICIGGLYDEIVVSAFHGSKRGTSIVPAQGDIALVTVSIKDIAN